MFIPARNTWHPLGRAPSKQAPSPEPPNQDEPTEFDQDQEELEGVEPDEAQLLDEDAELSDADFYRQMRADIEGVRAGMVPSMTDAMRPPIQDRPWSPRRKRRDRHGKAF